MKRKTISVFLVCTMLLSLFMAASTFEVHAANNNSSSVKNGDVIDIGIKLRHLEKDEEYIKEMDQKIKESAKFVDFNEESEATDEENDSNFTFNGGTKTFLGYDSVYGSYLKEYTLRSIGENVEIWVANDLGFYTVEDQEDPYNRAPFVITQEQIDTLTYTFDQTIYPKDTEFFGIPDSHIGENALFTQWFGLDYTPESYIPEEYEAKERVILLVDNIRDEQYYDPEYPFFIAGFYSSSFERYFDRNIINLDAKDWNERLVSTFFGTAAHEFQHLIHDDNDSLEETYINEGMSDFAEYLCFGEHPWRHVNFFLEHPENSLVEWDDHYAAETGPETLADYGQAYLLQLYLYDQYGKDFVRELATDGDDQGFVSINKILKKFGEKIDFNEIFRRFSIAVAIDSPQPGNRIYNFNSIDIKVNFESAEAFEKDGVPAWGGNYKIINNSDKIRSIIFDGVDFLPTPWKVVNDPLGSDNKVLWGNNGHEIDNQIIFEADLTKVDTSVVDAVYLEFDNYIDIEEEWDFGIVQISKDNGLTWNSLANENTRYDIVEEGYPAIKQNLPGFTGYYDNWTKERFDISTYIGHNVLINFRYMTDWGYNDSGWFIDNIEIPEIGYFNDCSSTESFISPDEVNKIYIEYAVAFINERILGKGKEQPLYKVVNVDPFNVTEEDALQLKQLFSDGKNYMIIWYAAPDGKKGTVDYSYEIITKNDSKKKK